ncbi:MAG: DUF2232 domain-containing protein [Bdellovibrionales bacterium]
MSTALRAPLKALFLTLTTVFLSLATIVVATVPLVILRREFGRGIYLALSAAAIGALLTSRQAETSIVLFTAFLLVAVYVEAKELGLSHMYSGAIGILFVAGSLYCAGHFWLRSQGSSFTMFFTEKIEMFSQQLQAMDPKIKLDTATLVAQTPSAMIILLAVSIWLAMLWDVRMNSAPALDEEGPRGLETFRAPDWFVWIFLASILGSFLELNVPAVQVAATNVLNIAVLVYFFQGIAIVGMFFRKQKMGPFWQALGYFLLIAQLFLFVAMLGFIDLWIDFRAKMIKKSEQRTGEV